MSRPSKSLLVLLGLITTVALTICSAIVHTQRGGGAAPPADAGPFGALRWRSIGPRTRH